MFAAKQTLQRAITAPRNALVLRNMSLNCARMTTVSVRGFSNYSQVNSGAAKLQKSLEKEIKYEHENYTQLEDIETFLNDSGFAFSEQENGINLTLKKTVGDKSIEIQFEARQPLPEDEQPEHEEDQDEEQGMSENYCDFTIFIANADGKKGLVIDATSMDTEINYNNVATTSNIPEERKIHRFERQMKQYAGPDYSTLDERIQTAMAEYLEGFGVNEHLCAFVECMSLDKDQRLYMQWLTNLKEFIEE